MTKLVARCVTAGSVLALSIVAGCSGNVVNENDLTATVTGKVTDNTGVGVPNVRVHLINNLDLRDVQTDTAGVYTIKTMPAGEYELSITKPKDYTIAAGVLNPRNISITTSSTNTFNFSLVRAPGSPAAAGPWSVTVNDYFFFSPEITIPKGTTVTWQSYGGDAHSVTVEVGEVFTSGIMRKGQRFSHTFNTSNTVIQYHCIYHPDIMFGTVRVVESD
jgi:plastocyanin